jgi:hypothetical protein
VTNRSKIIARQFNSGYHRYTDTTGSTPFEQLGIHLIDQLCQAAAFGPSSWPRATLQPLATITTASPISRLPSTTDNTRFERLGLHLID